MQLISITIETCFLCYWFLWYILKWQYRARNGAGAGAKTRTKVEPEPKLNNFGTATLLFKKASVTSSDTCLPFIFLTPACSIYITVTAELVNSCGGIKQNVTRQVLLLLSAVVLLVTAEQLWPEHPIIQFNATPYPSPISSSPPTPPPSFLHPSPSPLVALFLLHNPQMRNKIESKWQKFSKSFPFCEFN